MRIVDDLPGAIETCRNFISLSLSMSWLVLAAMDLPWPVPAQPLHDDHDNGQHPVFRGRTLFERQNVTKQESSTPLDGQAVRSFNSEGFNMLTTSCQTKRIM